MSQELVTGGENSTSTNVSRSGRIRKKNSLLAEYESVDEIEVDKPKKRGRKESESSPSSPGKRRNSGIRKKPKTSFDDDIEDDDDIPMPRLAPSTSSYYERDLEIDLPPPKLKVPVPILGAEETVTNGSESDSSSSSIPMTSGAYKSKSDNYNGQGHYQPSSQMQTYNQSARVKLKPGPKPGQGQGQRKGPKYKPKKKPPATAANGNKSKAVRKDKGIPRITGYTLWSTDRREVLSKKYPQLDSVSLNKRLSDIWDQTPLNQKKLWKNKANKLTQLTTNKISAGNIKNSAPPPPAGKKRGRPRLTPEIRGNIGKKSNSKRPVIGAKIARKNINEPKNSNSVGSTALSATTLGGRSEEDLGSFKVVGTGPLDVAAHFALLGESLSTIGERLMDVERQPVSGSLSVLMDSLLCSITPLVVLTQQVPELQCIPQPRLTRLLDHIAYIMPGL